MQQQKQQQKKKCEIGFDWFSPMIKISSRLLQTFWFERKVLIILFKLVATYITIIL